MFSRFFFPSLFLIILYCILTLYGELNNALLPNFIAYTLLLNIDLSLCLMCIILHFSYQTIYVETICTIIYYKRRPIIHVNYGLQTGVQRKRVPMVERVSVDVFVIIITTFFAFQEQREMYCGFATIYISYIILQKKKRKTSKHCKTVSALLLTLL